MSLFLLISAGAFAQSDPFSYLYYTISDIMSPTIDPNSGSTGFRSLLIPMGGIAEGMGTAYSAVAKDASFFDYNPSASASLEYTELSLFHNNWISDSKVEGAVYTMRFNDLGIGLAGKWVYLPFSEYSDFGERASKGYYSEATAVVNMAYNFFSSYYFSGLSVGGNAKIVYRAVPDYADNNGNLVPGSGLAQSAIALMLDGGVLTRFNFLKFYSSRAKNFSVAAVLKNVGFSLLESGERTPAPTMVTAGLSYSPLRPMTFSLDMNQPINLVDQSRTESFSLAAGFQLSFTDFFSLQSGLLLKGGNPRITAGAAVDIENLSIIANYTLDLTTQLLPLNRISLEVKFNLGDRGRLAAQKNVEELYLSGLEDYAKGNPAKAIELWNEALKIDPRFEPARESMVAAQAALDLQKRMEELQRLEK